MEFADFHSAAAALLDGIRTTLRTELTSIWLPIQLGLIALAAVIARALCVTIRNRADFVSLTMGWPPALRMIVHALIRHLWLIAFILVLSIVRISIRAEVENPRTYLLLVALNLSTAWLVVDVVTSVIKNQFVRRIVSIAIWTVAALSILRLIEPVAASLDSPAVAFSIGGLRLTPLLILKTVVLLVVTVWAANVTSNFLDKRLEAATDLTPSIQVMMAKLIRIALITLAVVVVLNSMGIDLSVLAFFSGAVGLGLGFGLQKIVSNLVSGIILLADKSIKPGDVISVGEHFGRVGKMGARHTSVDTRDGREYLIPNEDFITQRVANWTYSSDLVRLSVKFNTTYDSDPREVQKIAVGAALSLERVMKKPAPHCMLSAFGPGALEFEMWFWITNPAAGIANVKSDVLLALWDALDKPPARLAKPGPARVIYEMAEQNGGGKKAPAPPKPKRGPKSPFA